MPLRSRKWAVPEQPWKKTAGENKPVVEVEPVEEKAKDAPKEDDMTPIEQRVAMVDAVDLQRLHENEYNIAPRDFLVTCLDGCGEWWMDYDPALCHLSTHRWDVAIGKRA